VIVVTVITMKSDRWRNDHFAGQSRPCSRA
jgi:hypothetical protein